jgi:hypothetical protein
MATSRKRNSVAASLIPALIPALIGGGTEAWQSIQNRAPTVTTTRARSGRTPPCKSSLSECPVYGCEESADTAHGYSNYLKRHAPSGNSPVELTLDDFVSLQSLSDGLVGEGIDIEKEDRQSKLRDLTVSSGQVNEGDLVRVTGFLVGSAHANSGESVNCRLTGGANNDFHIPLGSEPDGSEFAGIVVEMIPQHRPAEWNLGKLHRVQKLEHRVLVTGQLFYDNEHVVNDDEDDPKGGQPKRASLWEVHRVTAFAVCDRQDSDCDPAQLDQWTSLEKWIPPANQ